MALSYGLSLNISLVISIQNKCTLANNITSVERLHQCLHIPSEAPEVIEENKPSVNWPTVGKVEIQDLEVINCVHLTVKMMKREELEHPN